MSCKRSKINKSNFYCSHIIAEVKGGSQNINNLIPLCSECSDSINTENFYTFASQIQGIDENIIEKRVQNKIDKYKEEIEKQDPSPIYTDKKNFKDFPLHVKKMVISFLDDLFININGGNVIRYDFLHEKFMEIFALEKIDNVALCFHSNEKVMKLFKFIEEHVVGTRNTYTANNLSNFGFRNSNLSGKSLVILNNKRDYNPVEITNIRSKLKNVVSTELSREKKFKNSSSFVIVTKRNILKRNNNDSDNAFITIDLTNYVMNAELENNLKMNGAEMGEALYWYSYDYLKNNKRLNIKQIDMNLFEMNDGNVFSSYLVYLREKQIFKNRILSIDDFFIEYKSFCEIKYGSMYYYDANKFLVLYNDFRSINDIKKNKHMKSIENKLHIDNLIVIKSLINRNKYDLILEYVKDVLLFEKKNMNVYFSEEYKKFKSYCLLVHNRSPITKTSETRIFINKCFGKDTIREPRKIMKISWKYMLETCKNDNLFNSLDIEHKKKRSNRGRSKKDDDD